MRGWARIAARRSLNATHASRLSVLCQALQIRATSEFDEYINAVVFVHLFLAQLNFAGTSDRCIRTRSGERIESDTKLTME